MSYTKITTGFKDHETVLTAAHLQHMENGIADNDAALVNRVRTDTNAQGLGTSQKRNARTNIDVPSTAEMTAAVAAEADLRSAADTAMETKTDGIQEEVNQTKEDITDLQAMSSSMVKTKTVTGNPVTIHDALAGKAKKLVVNLEPKQDLHGYDKPWVGGSGKNKAAFDQYNSVLSGISVTYNAGAVTLSGTSTALRDFSTSFSFNSADRKLNLPAGEYIISIDKYYDLNAGGNILYLTIRNTSTNASRYVGVGSDLVYTTTIKENEVIESAFIRVASGTVCSDVTIKPMIALASESNGAFEPYSNICPIKGFDSVEVVDADVNLYDKSQVLYGKNWLNGNSGNRAVFVAKTEKGKTLHLRAAQHGNTHRVVIVGADKFGSNAVQSFNKNFQPGLSTVSYEVTADEYVICQFERYQDTANSDVKQDDIDCWNIAISYSEINSISLNLVSSAGSTVYGGTVTVNEDGSGTLVVDRACVNASTLTWIKSALNNCFVASDGFPNELEVHASHHIFSGETSYGYTKLSYDGVYSSSTDRAISWRSPGSSASQKGVLIRDSNLSSIYADFNLTNFKTAVSDLEILIPITPTTHQLTATQLQTLIGTNHIWTDGTSLVLDYSAEKYSEVDKLLNAFPVRKIGPNKMVTIDDGSSGIPVKELVVTVEPKQELHGYHKPWVGGAGKNLCPTMEPTNQNISSFGSIVTIINSDGSVTLNGTTASGARHYALSPAITVKAGTSYKLTGCPTGGSTQTWRLDIRDASGTNLDPEFSSLIDTGAGGITLTPTTTHEIRIAARLDTNVTANNLTFYPMLRLASETDATYEPYENICPITGHDGVTVTRTGKNLWVDEDAYNDGNMAKNGRAYTNTGTDTKTAFNLMVQALVNDTISSTSQMVQVSSVGRVSATIVINDVKVNKLRIKHNGSRSDLKIAVPWSNTGTFTVSLDVTCNNPSVAGGLSIKDIQVEEGENATDYQADQTVTIHVPTVTGGTVYGGTLNVTTGELVMDKELFIQDGSGNISILSEFDSGNVFWDQTRYFPLDNYANNYITNQLATNTARNSNEAPYGSYVYSQTIRYKVPKTIAETVAQLKAYLAKHPLQILFPLATPIAYQLTPQEVTTLLGNNTFSCDAGKITLSYRADPSLLINKLMTALAAYGITG